MTAAAPSGTSLFLIVLPIVFSGRRGVDRSRAHSTRECAARIIQAAAQEACGLYALEGVMNTSSDYHQPVLEALCAFVRCFRYAA